MVILKIFNYAVYLFFSVNLVIQTITNNYRLRSKGSAQISYMQPPGPIKLIYKAYRHLYPVLNARAGQRFSKTGMNKLVITRYINLDKF